MTRKKKGRKGIGRYDKKNIWINKKKKGGKEIGIEDMIKRIFERTFDKKKKGEEIAI